MMNDRGGVWLMINMSDDGIFNRVATSDDIDDI
jgi:hypothetical protein